MRYTKLVWDDLQLVKLSKEAPDWERRKEKIVEAMTSSTEIFRQYKHANGQLMKLWKLLDESTVILSDDDLLGWFFILAAEAIEENATIGARNVIEGTSFPHPIQLDVGDEREAQIEDFSFSLELFNQRSQKTPLKFNFRGDIYRKCVL